MSITISLSNETIALLKTAQRINNSILLNAGNMIKTVAPSGAIVFETQITETFPETLSIYELNRLLSVLGALPNPVLEFYGLNYVTIKSGKVSVNYRYTDESFTQHPGSSINLPSVDLEVDISSEELANIDKMAGILGHSFLEINVRSQKVFLKTLHVDLVDSGNDSVVELCDAPGADDGVYRLAFKNLILPAGDYTLKVCRSGIVHFASKTGKTNVYVGLEVS